jgi:hypothetical protein
MCILRECMKVLSKLSSARAREWNAQELTHFEPCLCNPCGLLPGVQYVCLGRDVTVFPDPQGLVQETVEEWLVSLIMAIREDEGGRSDGAAWAYGLHPLPRSEHAPLSPPAPQTHNNTILTMKRSPLDKIGCCDP